MVEIVAREGSGDLDMHMAQERGSVACHDSTRALHPAERPRLMPFGPLFRFGATTLVVRATAGTSSATRSSTSSARGRWWRGCAGAARQVGSCAAGMADVETNLCLFDGAGVSRLFWKVCSRATGPLGTSSKEGCFVVGRLYAGLTARMRAGLRPTVRRDDCTHRGSLGARFWQRPPMVESCEPASGEPR